MIAVVASWLLTIWAVALALGAFLDALQWCGTSSIVEQAFQFIVHVYQELWILVPPAAVINIVMNDHTWVGRAADGLLIVWWWRFRDWPDDNNRWRRRGRKLKEKVVVRAGRLAVEPA